MISSLLVFSILLNLCSNNILYITFKINQNEIVKTICVMRKAKSNTCQGHCALKAALKKQAENEKNHENTLKDKVESSYTVSEIDYTITPILLFNTTKKNYFHHHSKPKSVSFAIFHPPTA